ncbi:hypothetical protein GCM10029992_10210 [Glycomyces albus]
MKVYFHTATVRSGVSEVNRHPPPKTRKNHGPETIVIPTFPGGLYDTYSLTIRHPSRCFVSVRTPCRAWRRRPAATATG